MLTWFRSRKWLRAEIRTLCGKLAAANHLIDQAKEEMQILDHLRAAEYSKFEEHTAHVAIFLNEMYSLMIDPLADAPRTVTETCDALREAAKNQREALRCVAADGQVIRDQDRKSSAPGTPGIKEKDK